MCAAYIVLLTLAFVTPSIWILIRICKKTWWTGKGWADGGWFDFISATAALVYFSFAVSNSLASLFPFIPKNLDNTVCSLVFFFLLICIERAHSMIKHQKDKQAFIQGVRSYISALELIYPELQDLQAGQEAERIINLSDEHLLPPDDPALIAYRSHDLDRFACICVLSHCWPDDDLSRYDQVRSICTKVAKVGDYIRPNSPYEKHKY